MRHIEKIQKQHKDRTTHYVINKSYDVFECFWCGKLNKKPWHNYGQDKIKRFCNRTCQGLAKKRGKTQAEWRIRSRARKMINNELGIKYGEYEKDIYELQIAYEKAKVELAKIMGIDPKQIQFR